MTASTSKRPRVTGAGQAKRHIKSLFKHSSDIPVVAAALLALQELNRMQAIELPVHPDSLLARLETRRVEFCAVVEAVKSFLEGGCNGLR